MGSRAQTPVVAVPVSITLLLTCELGTVTRATLLPELGVGEQAVLLRTTEESWCLRINGWAIKLLRLSCGDTRGPCVNQSARIIFSSEQCEQLRAERRPEHGAHRPIADLRSPETTW